MSVEDQSQASSEGKDQVVNGGSQDNSQDVVHRKAYEEVTKDMLKYKSERKELQARLNEIETQMKAAEEQKLKDNEKWQQLAEQKEKELEHLKQQTLAEKNRYLDSVKRNALKNELGGKINEAYLVHADINSIEFNEDGTLNPESVAAVANKFREDHSTLIPSNANNSITNQAPSNEAPAPKSLEQMSTAEKIALLNNRK